MKIRINGKEEAVGSIKSLEDLVSEKQLVPEHIVVEHNSRIVPREEWQKTTVAENDNVEIVSFVGGG